MNVLPKNLHKNTIKKVKYTFGYPQMAIYFQYCEVLMAIFETYVLPSEDHHSATAT